MSGAHVSTEPTYRQATTNDAESIANVIATVMKEPDPVGFSEPMTPEQVRTWIARQGGEVLRHLRPGVARGGEVVAVIAAVGAERDMDVEDERRVGRPAGVELVVNGGGHRRRPAREGRVGGDEVVPRDRLGDLAVVTGRRLAEHLHEASRAW